MDECCRNKINYVYFFKSFCPLAIRRKKCYYKIRMEAELCSNYKRQTIYF